VLVAKQRRFAVSFVGINYEDSYFRALFLRAPLDDSIRALHRRAAHIFDVQSTDYMPHLSLLYGNLPLSAKQALSALAKGAPVHVTIQRIDLYKSEGNVEEWRKIAEAYLT